MPANNHETLNVIDISKLKISQDFASQTGIKKAIITIPIRKPNPQTFVRVRPESEFRLQTAIIEIKEENETYLVIPDLWNDLSSEIVAKVFFTAITRQGDLFLWPIRLPSSDGRIDDYNASALEAATIAEKTWIRLKANRSLGAYDVFEATGDIANPAWPDISFQKIVEIAFRGRIIDNLNHPVLRKLRGEL